MDFGRPKWLHPVPSKGQAGSRHDWLFSDRSLLANRLAASGIMLRA